MNGISEEHKYFLYLLFWCLPLILTRQLNIHHLKYINAFSVVYMLGTLALILISYFYNATVKHWSVKYTSAVSALIIESQQSIRWISLPLVFFRTATNCHCVQSVDSCCRRPSTLSVFLHLNLDISLPSYHWPSFHLSCGVCAATVLAIVSESMLTHWPILFLHLPVMSLYCVWKFFC